MGLGRLELPTSRLSGVRSNHLSYRPREPENLILRDGRLNHVPSPASLKNATQCRGVDIGGIDATPIPCTVRKSWPLRRLQVYRRTLCPNPIPRSRHRAPPLVRQDAGAIGGTLSLGLAVSGRRADLRKSPPGPVDWDNDVTRYAASLGYRIVRNAGVLLSAYEQIQSNEVDADSRFAGIRLWWAF
jgi:hypothetical protein